MRIALNLLAAVFFLSAAAFPQPVPPVLTLDQAVTLALERHGEIEAAQAAITATSGARKQAAYSPNPMFYVQTENWRFGGTPGFSPGHDLDVFAYVSQTIETGGKKRHRVEVAAANQQIAELRRKATEWQIRQGVKTAFARVLAAERKGRLLSESREVFGRLQRYHQVRFELGALPEVDVIKVRLEVEKTEMELAASGMELERTKIELLRAMGVSDPAASFTLSAAPASPTPAAWKSESLAADLIDAAMAQRHDVLLARALVERSQAGIGVQRAAAKPDVVPYFGYKRTTSFNTLIGGVTVPLPLLNRNEGAIEEAVAQVREHEAILRAVQSRTRAEVAAALVAVRHRAGMLAGIEARMMDTAEQTSRITLAAYEEGGMELLEVLDAQRSQNQIALLRLQVLSDYELSRIDLETSVGAESLPAPGAWNRVAN